MTSMGEAINLVLNALSLYFLILLFADQRRIERRYEVLLHGLPQLHPHAPHIVEGEPDEKRADLRQ